MLERSFKLNFVTILPSLSRRTFHTNCKLTIAFLNCFFKKYNGRSFQVTCNKNFEIENFRGSCFIQGFILGQFYNNFFLNSYSVRAAMLNKTCVGIFGFQHNSTLKRIFNNVFVIFVKNKPGSQGTSLQLQSFVLFYRKFLTDFCKILFFSRQFYLSATMVGWSQKHGRHERNKKLYASSFIVTFLCKWLLQSTCCNNFF